MGGTRRLFALLLCLGALAPAAPAAAAVNSYVALGDSYASGPITPLYENPLGCLKSTNNYPHLLAQRLKIADFRDMTCAGASADDMYSAQGVTPGPNPPQFSALTPATQLVTLQIGGNDIGFSSIASNCLSFDPVKPQCTQKFVVDGHDQISDRIQASKPQLAAVLADIHARSPLAHVLVVNYSAIFPTFGPYCWPILPVASGDVPYLRAKEEELNAMLAAVAAAGNADLVDVYAASYGHDACKLPLVRWVEPVLPFILAAPVHPNITGMDAMAKLIAARL